MKEELLKRLESNIDACIEQGYHCSEGTLRAVAEILGLPLSDDILKASSGFRGGGGGMRERCGCVEAGIILIGLRYGRLQATESSAPYSYLIRKLHERFLSEQGSYTCHDLYPTAKLLHGNCHYYHKNGTMILGDFMLDANKMLAEKPSDETK